MNETSLCAIKEGMFLSVFDEIWQFSIRMGMIIKFYAMAVIKTEENEQSQFLMLESNLHIERKQSHGGHSSECNFRSTGHVFRQDTSF